MNGYFQVIFLFIFLLFRVAHENITERYVWRENSMCDMGTWDVGFGHGNDVNLNKKKY